jgi:hypothetical protein
MQHPNRPRAKVEKRAKALSDGEDNSLKVYGAIQNNVFGTVLLSLGLLWGAGNHLSEFGLCRTLRNDRS